MSSSAWKTYLDSVPSFVNFRNFAPLRVPFDLHLACQDAFDGRRGPCPVSQVVYNWVLMTLLPLNDPPVEAAGSLWFEHGFGVPNPQAEP